MNIFGKDIDAKNVKWFVVAFVLVCAALLFFVLSPMKVTGEAQGDVLSVEPSDTTIYEYGIPISEYDVVVSKVGSGEFFSTLLDKHGVSQKVAYDLSQKCKGVFDLRQIRVGNEYHAYFTKDSLSRMEYLVYEKDAHSYVVFSLKDSLSVSIQEKEIETTLKYAEVTINNSLWADLQNSGVTPLLALTLSDIYAWSIDFFGLQRGDSFKALYEVLSYKGEILEIKNDSPTVYASDDLARMAKDIIKDGKSTGTKDNLTFLKTDKNGYVLVVFMDNTVVNESAMTLFRYTLIFGSAALVLFFFLSVYLARKIVSPLEESYQKQKQFISDAGHELKTPVSVVSANAELLSREIGKNQWLDNIFYENERMGVLVGQLLELARTESVTPQMEHLDFSRLVQGEALPFESVAFEKGLRLICDTEREISVEGNSTQLKQLVSILLDNGIRHGTDGNIVNLRLTKVHGFAQLSVINNGDEIPEEQRKQIFERFYRVDTARNGEDKHYGLGLAIAKSIADVHKGSIDVFCYNSLVEFRVMIPIK